MKSLPEFLERFRPHLACMALYGTVSELRDGPLARASKIMEIPGEVEKLLGEMYEFLQEPVSNGKPETKPVGTALPSRNGVK